MENTEEIKKENYIYLDELKADGFEFALTKLRLGIPVARKSWEKDNKFIFMQVPSNIDISIVPKMQSLPDLVKTKFTNELTRVGISYTDQICMQDDRGFLVNYTPTCSDILAEDWTVVS